MSTRQHALFIKAIFFAGIFVFCLTTFAQEESVKIQWEYLNKPFITGNEKKMNEYGEQGWEYVFDGIFIKEK